MLLRNIHHETPTVERLVGLSIGVPHRPDFHLAITLRHLARRPPLLLYIGLNHLRRRARRQISVFAFLQQSANHNLWIPAWLNPGKPAVILKLALAHSPQLSFERIADSLCAARFAGEVNPLQM